jgi:hypothetical protein
VIGEIEMQLTAFICELLAAALVEVHASLVRRALLVNGHCKQTPLSELRNLPRLNPRGQVRDWCRYRLIEHHPGTDCISLQIKLKLSHYTPRRNLGERRYSSYSFSTSALDGSEWSASRPCRALAPGKGPPVPNVQEAGWAPEPVWIQRLEERSFRLCRDSSRDRSVVQPVARHYTA